MRVANALILTLVAAFPVQAITIETIPVGNADNANDPATGDLYGGVGTAYNIGKYEVTVGQYTEFLNAVADIDTYALYNTSMATNLNIAGISRSGVSGSYSYSVIGSANKPVTYVSWGDAARFCNWLHNNQPAGVQNASTTERGAYTLDGATTTAALNAISRNAGAQWFIPSDNEWYKAAFHQPAAQGGDADNYWTYATRTNSVPYSDQPPGSDAPTQSNTANFYRDDAVANLYDDGWAVTGLTTDMYSSDQNYLTDAGAYTSSTSFYGTLDQAGNVWEWNEGLPNVVSQRPIRGGSWYDSYLPASERNGDRPTSEYFFLGFRVARQPLLIGDNNFDGTVDAADYVVWRRWIGYVVPPWTKGDSNGNGFVEWLDYGPWRENYGRTWNTGSSVTVNAVPEPTAAASLAVVLFGLVAGGRRNR